MSMTLVVTLAGIVIIAVLGFLGRRKATTNLSEWTVAGRKYRAWVMWFLQAGEIFTIFSFLGMAGLAFAGGAPVMYSVAYSSLMFVVLYFAAPIVWRRARDRGQLTLCDFLGDFYGSPAFAVIVAICGVVFLLPYLQLQITGLGLATELATGDATSGTLSMLVGFVLVLAFVLWAGIRGVATTSYFKDALMVIVLLVLIIVIPAHFDGGIGATFEKLVRTHPDMLTIHGGHFDGGWFVSSVIVSALGAGFMVLPHQWPAILAAASRKTLRRNYVFLPLYAVVVILPITIGFTGIGVVASGIHGNGVLLALAAKALSPWFVGVVVVVTAAAAMVPAAGIIVGMSSLVARNIVRLPSDRGQFWVNQAAVVIVTLLALVLAIMRPTLLANLLLLTYSGLVQLFPAIALALLARRVVGVWSILAGLIVGEAVLIWLTFGGHLAFVQQVNSGIVALVPNMLVVAVGAAIERLAACSGTAPEASA